jgi:dolichyl-phosphate-mannose-protein mannosyltransferase
MMFGKVYLDMVRSKIKKARLGWPFWLVLGLAILVRLLLLPIPNIDGDVVFQTWSHMVTVDGIHTIYDYYDPVKNPDNECQYPPGYIYVLWAAGKAYQHFFSPGFKQESILFLIILRIPTVLADLALGIIIFMVLRRWSGVRAAHVAFAVYALSPAMIWDSTNITQIDSVQSLLMVGTVLLLVSGKDTMAVACLTVAVMTKLQAVILLPLVLFTVAQRGHWRSLLRGVAISAGIFLLMSLPFILHDRIPALLRTLLTPIGTAPFLTLNAFNIWWLISGGKGGSLFDTEVLLWFVTPRLIGLVLLAAAAALGLYRIRNDGSRNSVILAAAFTCLAFFMVCTEMTERYSLPTLPLLLLAVPGNRRIAWLYGLLSVTIFINLYLIFPLLRLSPWDALRLPHSNFIYLWRFRPDIQIDVLWPAPEIRNVISKLVSVVHVVALMYCTRLMWSRRNGAVLPARLP